MKIISQTNGVNQNMNKTSQKIKENLPDGETLSLYVATLKQFLKDNKNISEENKNLIENLPHPRKIRQDFSYQECRILYETLEYLWDKITGYRIIPEKEIIHAPETLFGNYWLIKNGIILQGINHYTIIKQNAELFASLLDISGLTLQHYLCSRPNKLIGYIIKNGGIRLFVTKDKRLYAQMSQITYAQWGKNKIKNMNFKNKIIKVIDTNIEYGGWKSGISLKIS